LGLLTSVAGARVALLGTGAIAGKHAQAYRNIGIEVIACSNRSEVRGREFAQRWKCEFVPDAADLIRFPHADFIDVCTYPDTHLEVVRACAAASRPVLLEKPIAIERDAARAIVEIARSAGIVLGVVSQKRYDDAMLFLKRALDAGRLGKLIEADAYIKWFRTDEYYARLGKGSWALEGGGALMNQAIHQVDLLLHLAGSVKTVQAMWQRGARHQIEAEDVINALLQFESGATGVLQASTAFWPGTTERIEVHGTKGLAIVSGDRLTTWQVLDDAEANALDPAPVAEGAMSGASDPMAIPLTAFERQLTEFAEAVRASRQPATGGEAGFRALDLVIGAYDAARIGAAIQLMP
jgi:UDP-N-acetyl-2-amino-2-deoxyglucuronate dehydrogenase